MKGKIKKKNLLVIRKCKTGGDIQWGITVETMKYRKEKREGNRRGNVGERERERGGGNVTSKDRT